MDLLAIGCLRDLWCWLWDRSVLRGNCDLPPEHSVDRDSSHRLGSTEKADAEREIASWRKRSGKEFGIETDAPGGDHNYDAVVANLLLARLHIVEPTGITVGITMNDGELRSVTVIESVGWYGVASVWIQEWFDEQMPNHFHAYGNRRPYVVHVEFPSSLPEEQRRRAFAVDTGCLVRPRGCKTAEAILPGISQLE